MICCVNKGERCAGPHPKLLTTFLDPYMSEKFADSGETKEESTLGGEVTADMRGQRLDQAAALLFPEYSRARLQGWIRDGNLLLNGKPAKGKDKVLGGEILTLMAEVEGQEHWEAEALPLDIVHEDDAIIVINKPAGLVVHPAAGNRTGTLLNGLLHHCRSLNQVPRAGIVHRLDKDTSGLMVVAKTLESHLDLVEQLRVRTVSRIYMAVVYGVLTAGGTVDEPLGRHPVHRTRRAVSNNADTREAVTHYRILKKFRSHTLVQCELKTGRTHQIRVHMAYIGYPLVGDPLYGGRPRIPKGAAPALINCLKHFKRQALHAWQLGLEHPVTGESMAWQVDLPDDMQALQALMEQDNEI
jgi:23S rRNA pseudouridine1911/1915/1917 synthase